MLFVELRPYAWDLCAWLDGDEGIPEERANYVLFWRDRDFDARREEANPLELAVLQAVLRGEPSVGARAVPWRETLEDLHAAGILLGRLPPAG